MNYKDFYTSSRIALVESLSSMWLPGRIREQRYMKWLLSENEPLLAQPVFQSIFPWESGPDTFEEHASKLGILDAGFVKALSDAEKEYAFPLDRHPYKHQTRSWKGMLSPKRKTIVVTSGTGSGKTECFMIPVLQDIYRRAEKNCVQAIFLYPLNALMKSQQQRIDAWCRALPGKVTYAIYNGDTEKDSLPVSKTEPAFPQLITRPQIRQTPPQILFTNPTMLNYMLVRKDDRTILEQSQGKLRWILLDEAHTYTGSSAAELSLQLRRVLDAFGVSIDDVNFAVTSATIGDKGSNESFDRLKTFVANLTGKDIGSIEIIDGHRIIPELDEYTASEHINDINKKFSTRITYTDILRLRTRLNNSASLDISDISKLLPGSSSKSTEDMLEIMDALGEKVHALDKDGSDAALLPTRAHFFIRAINGMYVCPNPDCTRHNSNRLPIGSLTSIQKTICPECKTKLLEVAACPHCGELIIVGEESISEGYRMKQAFVDLDDTLFLDMEDTSDDDSQQESESRTGDAPAAFSDFYLSKPIRESLRNHMIVQERKFDMVSGRVVPAEHADPSAIKYKSATLETTRRDVCPACGNEIGRLNFFRVSSNFMGRVLAPIILENAEPAEKQDLNLIWQGRKFISFTDSRQGTARSAMGLNQDVERNWIRSAIFHNLADKRLEGFIPGGGLTAEEQQKYDFFVSQGDNLPGFFRAEFESLKRKLAPNQEPEVKSYEWNAIKDELLHNADFDKLFKHLSDARGRIIGVNKLDKNEYLSSLFLDQFGWIPKRANSMENMGLVKVVYPSIDSGALCPATLAAKGLSDKDWKDFLKICVDYVIRGGRHYMISENQSDYLTQNNLSTTVYPSNSTLTRNGCPVQKWPSLRLDAAGKPLEKQSRIVLLLCAAFGFYEPEDMEQPEVDLVNAALDDAWRFISSNVLELTDIDNKGYKLNLAGSKVRLELVTSAWLCPVDNVIVDTVFKGYSPRMNGYISANNFSRFIVGSPLHFPYYPFNSADLRDSDIENWIDTALKQQCELGVVPNVQRNIYRRSPIYIAAEHSAQQEREALERYEKDFVSGKLNILSCSTTMEMGVDIGGVSEVVLNNVPPKSANYLQRAGRAGRRGETKTMVVTFCPPNPVGSNTWENPKWPIEHITEMPIIKMESRQLIQRHVNALFFACWVNAYSQGLRLTEKLGDFFDGDNSAYMVFTDYIQQIHYGIIPPGIQDAYKRVVEDTSMESVSISDAAHAAIKDITSVHDFYKGRLDALQQVIDSAIQNSGGGSVTRAATRQKDNLQQKTNLLSFLAENNFLPSAGIPTGLVECTLESKGSAPSMHLSQAISSYAPGTQVVKNEWVYEPAGIKLKTRYDENTTRYLLQRCVSCGYSTITMGAAKTTCPKCNGRMAGMSLGNSTVGTRSTEIVEPVGFTVAYGDKPSRKLDGNGAPNFVQPILLEMEPWPRTRVAPKLLMRASTPRSEIMFYNPGANNNGFVFCPYCGRMESESPVGSSYVPLTHHKHLETGARCDGSNLNALRRNVLLVGRYQTDFVEIKFFDRNNHQVTDTSTLYSLGVILSRKLTEVLGVNSEEVDFGYDPLNHTIFIYDTALGGSGYSPLLREYKNKVLRAAYNTLNNCTCERSCVHCLIDRRSQYNLNFLDRKKALEWLETELESRKAPESLKVLYPELSAITTDFESELFHLSRDRNLKSLQLYISSELNEWCPEEFPFGTIISDLKNQGVDISFVMRDSPETNGLSADKINEVLPFLYTHKIAAGDEFFRVGITPLLAASYLNGETFLFLGENISINLDQSWSSGNVYVTRIESLPSLSVISYDSILNSLVQEPEDKMFEQVIKANASTTTVLNALIDEHPSEWNSIKRKLGGQEVNITYSDRYVRTGLACTILSGMLEGIRSYFGVSILNINCTLPFEEHSGFNYPTPEYTCITDEFNLKRDRDEFLKTMLEERFDCPITVNSNSFAQHARFLTVETESFILSIRPDAGVGHGWSILHPTPTPKLSEMYENLTKELPLYNKQGNYSGILYTIVFKAKNSH